MHVGIDISNAVDPRPTGVARYIRLLIEHLGRLEKAPRVTLYCRPSRRGRGDPARLAPSHRLRWLRGIVPPGAVDVFHAPDLRAPLLCAAPLVITVHDLSALERDDHATARFVRRKRRQYHAAARRASRVLTHTEAVRGRIVARLGIETERIRAVPLADPLTALESPSPSPERGDTLLTVGGPSRRKGSHRIAALLEMWRREYGWEPAIEWVGSTPVPKARGFLDPFGYGERIRFHGHVADSELDAMYRRAQGLLVLSDTEGFAMPLLEAAARSCPVLAVESDTAREVLGDDAFWFDDTGSEPRSRECFTRFLDPVERHTVAERARHRAASFSWQETARRTLEVYDSALSAFNQRRG